jgi:hypothetical protein
MVLLTPRKFGSLSGSSRACMIVSSIRLQYKKRGTHTTPLATTHSMACKGSIMMTPLWPMGHARNMSVYPDSYNLMDTFLRGLPESMRAEICTEDSSFKNGFIKAGTSSGLLL